MPADITSVTLLPTLCPPTSYHLINLCAPAACPRTHPLPTRCLPRPLIAHSLPAPATRCPSATPRVPILLT
eukprot:365847-Chlamydomonas_euryale.AAC.32